jgi:hypothetical protein
MTLIIEPAPEGGPALVAKAVEDLRPPRRFGVDLLRRRPTPETTGPLPVYSLRLADLDLEVPTRAARQVGWRYIVREGDASSTVDLTAKAGTLRFHALRRGHRADYLAEACAVAATLDDGQDSYQLRILTLPPLRLDALWLAGARQERFVRLKQPARGEIAAFDFVAEARDLRGLRRTDREGPQGDLGS